jgi:hypothetical protein
MARAQIFPDRENEPCTARQLVRHAEPRRHVDLAWLCLDDDLADAELETDLLVANRNELCAVYECEKLFPEEPVDLNRLASGGKGKAFPMKKTLARDRGGTYELAEEIARFGHWWSAGADDVAGSC